MVQVFQPSPRAMQQQGIGQALGLGIGQNFPDPQQQVQRNLLEGALSKLPENANAIQMLKTIGPQLMTTPGGSQLLAELAPLLQKDASAKAYLASNNQGQDITAQNQFPGVGGSTGLNAMQQQEVIPSGEQYFKAPKPPVGKEGTYPKMSVLPEPIPLMTPEEMQQKQRQYISQSLAAGAPADPVAAQNLVQNEQNQRMMNNQQIEKERGVREEKQQQQSQRMIKRFENSSAQPKSEEDKIVFEKFANEAKDAANENDAYTYARAKYNQFDNARNGLIRESEIPGFATKMFQKAMGTYKEKESVMKDLKPHIQKLKDLGLENEARAILSNDVGLGMEDTELAMYPPSKEENNMYNKLARNPNLKKVDVLFSDEYLRFPGEESSLDPEKFIKFKDEIANILEKNKDTNLVAMRGVLNADKKYAWTDISTAIAELIDEGRFSPNNIQEQQLNVVKSPPIPGLGAMFKEFWKGTK